jgi:HEPN domain-containing protein
MSDRHVELALRWLEKADHDIITAQQTLLLPHGPTDTPCFHAKQAVEKA